MLAYTGPAWKQRVNRMSDNQIFAVYHRLSTTGKLDEAAQERKHRAASPYPQVQQLSFFDKEYAPG